MDIEQFKKDVASGQIKDLWYFYKRTEEEKQSATEATKQLSLFLQKEFHVDVYLIYGTLLGAIREKDFILYDHDVDIAYLSKYHTKEEVIEELRIIETKLKNKDLLSKTFNNNGHMHVWSPNKQLKIDVWTSWVENDSLYLIPFINGILTKQSLLPLQLDVFRGVEFNFPNNSEEILDCIYKNWKNPQPSNWEKLKWIEIL
jgi:hypothetical protein